MFILKIFLVSMKTRAEDSTVENVTEDWRKFYNEDVCNYTSSPDVVRVVE
jgi:hypothetical protein